MIPVILSSPDPMVKVRVITLKDYSEQALKTLHKVGVLHVEQGEELKPIDNTPGSLSYTRKRSKLMRRLRH